MKPLKSLALIELLLIPFFTKPRWCIEMFETDDPRFDHCGFNKDFMKSSSYGLTDENGDNLFEDY